MVANEGFVQVVDLSQYVGKTVTIAIYSDYDNPTHCASGMVVKSDAWSQIAASLNWECNVVYNGYEWVVNIRVPCKYIALYTGAYTLDTLPPYVPKGYAAELAECRLYYRPQQMYCLYCYSDGYAVGISFEPMRPGVIPTPVNAKAQTITGDDVAGKTTIFVTEIDRVSHVANPNFAYGNYYRVFSEFSSDL